MEIQMSGTFGSQMFMLLCPWLDIKLFFLSSFVFARCFCWTAPLPPEREAEIEIEIER